MKKRAISLVLSIVLTVMMISGGGITSQAATSLPSDLYLRQVANHTCTLVSAVMMMRARMYLSGNASWSSITETGARSVAWKEGSGLWYNFTYSINGNSMTVTHAYTSGISVAGVKSLLNQHPEGFELYCSGIPHAVFVTDCDGDTVYCADPASGYANCRRTLASSYLGAKYGSQANILSKTTDYWYISKYSIISGPHTHDKGEYVFKEAAHPHCNCYKCSVCGEIWKDELSRNYYDQCEICCAPHTHTKGEHVFKEAVHPHCDCYQCSICGQIWKDGESQNYDDQCIICVENHTHDKGEYVFKEAAHPHCNCYKCSVCGKIWKDELSRNYYDQCEICCAPHTHTKGEHVFKEAVHPHCDCYQCSICGQIWKDELSSNFYDQCEICCSPPSSAAVSVPENISYTVGDTITFTFSSAGGETYNLRIMNNGKTVQLTGQLYKSTYSYKLTEAGNYTAYISASNSYGSTDSPIISFAVSEKTVISGDIDEDGILNMTDVLILYRSASGQVTLTDTQAAVSDIDGNGVINMTDAFALYRQVSGAV